MRLPTREGCVPSNDTRVTAPQRRATCTGAGVHARAEAGAVTWPAVGDARVPSRPSLRTPSAAAGLHARVICRDVLFQSVFGNVDMFHLEHGPFHLERGRTSVELFLNIDPVPPRGTLRGTGSFTSDIGTR
jgi:hypothetical protein